MPLAWQLLDKFLIWGPADLSHADAHEEDLRDAGGYGEEAVADLQRTVHRPLHSLLYSATHVQIFPTKGQLIPTALLPFKQNNFKKKKI